MCSTAVGRTPGEDFCLTFRAHYTSQKERSRSNRSVRSRTELLEDRQYRIIHSALQQERGMKSCHLLQYPSIRLSRRFRLAELKTSSVFGRSESEVTFRAVKKVVPVTIAGQCLESLLCSADWLSESAFSISEPDEMFARREISVATNEARKVHGREIDFPADVFTWGGLR